MRFLSIGRPGHPCLIPVSSLSHHVYYKIVPARTVRAVRPPHRSPIVYLPHTRLTLIRGQSVALESSAGFHGPAWEPEYLTSKTSGIPSLSSSESFPSSTPSWSKSAKVAVFAAVVVVVVSGSWPCSQYAPKNPWSHSHRVIVFGSCVSQVQYPLFEHSISFCLQTHWLHWHQSPKRIFPFVYGESQSSTLLPSASRWSHLHQSASSSSSSHVPNPEQISFVSGLEHSLCVRGIGLGWSEKSTSWISQFEPWKPSSHSQYEIPCSSSWSHLQTPRSEQGKLLKAP